MCLTDSEGEGCVCYVMTECNAKRGAAMAGNRGKFCRCGRGTDGECRSESLWSRYGGEDHTATATKCGKRCRCGVSPRGQCCSESLRRGAVGMCCRNGRESREMVPLRKGNGWRMPFREPVEQVWRGGPYRNGSKMRKTVPLWCVSEGTMLFRESETGDRHERVNVLPQRQLIA